MTLLPCVQNYALAGSLRHVRGFPVLGLLRNLRHYQPFDRHRAYPEGEQELVASHVHLIPLD